MILCDGGGGAGVFGATWWVLGFIVLGFGFYVLCFVICGFRVDGFMV